MQQGRRTNDRRRRVLYSAHQAENESTSAASRRAAEKLREARCPQMAYGSRVHRRIRGRWFSLVPVRLRSMLLVTGSIFLLASILCVGHYAAVTWTPLSTRPLIARPLRLDRPDSFGRWCMIAMFTVTAGIALMTYQLRRYRNDDFGGHYRLWRVVIVVSVLASLNVLASLVDWTGAIIDAGFGKRVALAGSDWVRLVVTFGGAVLALRMIAELWHCRTALALMATSCILFVIPEAVQWNILKLESAGHWTLATTAPMLGCTTLLIAMLTYLRMLYREVKQVEDVSMLDRFQQVKMNLFQSSSNQNKESSTLSDGTLTHAKTKNRWWQRGRADDQLGSKAEQDNSPAPPKQNSGTKRVSTKKRKNTFSENETVNEGLVKEEMKQSQESIPANNKRRWFGLRRPKATDSDTGTQSGAKPTSAAGQTGEHSSIPNKLTRSSRSKTKATASKSQQRTDAADETEPDQIDAQSPRKGLMGWRRKKASKQQNEPEAEAPKHQSTQAPTGSKSTTQKSQNHAKDMSFEGDDIDWTSMSKAQRRRLRKQLKRQNKAA
ncbi:MAG: hypothetical protein CMM01_17225 [Rhodopirellula sp.]|nr:hypothetical protein [Rhodopirellula sp.]OUX50084.1 MAG: hypothetical protein CBE43_07960 [Rhodopirellula sp. TMED283]